MLERIALHLRRTTIWYRSAVVLDQERGLASSRLARLGSLRTPLRFQRSIVASGLLCPYLPHAGQTDKSTSDANGACRDRRVANQALWPGMFCSMLTLHGRSTDP